MNRRWLVLWLQASGWLALAGGVAGQEAPAPGPAAGRETVAAAGVDRAAVPELMRQGKWEEAGRAVAALLAADPADAEAYGWRRQIEPVDRWPVVVKCGNEMVTAELWLRRQWLGLDLPQPDGSLRRLFQWPLAAVDANYAESTAWVQPGYGVVGHGLKIKVGSEKHQVFTRFPFFEAISMERRIRSWQVRAGRPEAAPPVNPAAVVRGKDAAGLKETFLSSARDGRWEAAAACLQALVALAPDDPDLPRLRAEAEVVRQWRVRTWSPSDGYAGTLTLRRGWLTLEAEDYGGNPKKPQKNESFHFPLSALREASVCSERDYGAKVGSGGALDMVPGWASTVATGKVFGVELSFAGAGARWKLILRGESCGKYDAENAASVLNAGRGASR